MPNKLIWCEWDPVKNEPRKRMRGHARAKYSVGKGGRWLLCEKCVNLKKFTCFSKKPFVVVDKDNNSAEERREKDSRSAYQRDLTRYALRPARLVSIFND